MDENIGLNGLSNLSIRGSGPGAPRPLRIAISGAGIGGLYAAITLRQAGHHVEVYEASRFGQETGAAIGLPPNVVGLLNRIGFDRQKLGANDAEWVAAYPPGGDTPVMLRDCTDLATRFLYPWQLIHRVDLHTGLKDLATAVDGPGKPVTIHLQSRTVELDPGAPNMTLADGKVINADLILVADGIHSALRKYVIGHEMFLEPSGASAFRFLVPISKIKNDPQVRKFVQRQGELGIFYGTDRRIIVYPCRNNTELNFVAMATDEDCEGAVLTNPNADAESAKWNNIGSKDHMLNLFKTFHPDVIALLNMAVPESIKVWKLLDGPSLNTWVNGKSALLGDAAHPFLPHQGQGGAQAMEDAATLGVLLPLGITPEELHDRLLFYEKCRYDRATLIQDHTRDTAFHHNKRDPSKSQQDPMIFNDFNYDHDAYDYAKGALMRELASKARFQRMPLGYGPNPGPRQNADGQPRIFNATYRTCFITFKTHKSYLHTFMPTADFRIDKLGGWATATFSVTQLTNLEWLGGRGYSHFGLYIHDTEVKITQEGKQKEAHEEIYGNRDGKNMSNKCWKANDENPGYINDGTTASIKGDFISVLFENMADPIITGREELGFPKMYASLDHYMTDDTYQLCAGWEGTPFCRLTLKDLTRVTLAAPKPKSQPILTYKIVPPSTRAGQRLGADLGLDTAYPVVTEDPLVKLDDDSEWKGDSASITFTELKGEELQKAFPTIWHIVEKLREIQISEVIANGIIGTSKNL